MVSTLLRISCAIVVIVAVGHVLGATVNIIDVYKPQVFDYAVLRNQKPVVVFYYNKECRPCRWMLPILERMARDKSQSMYLAKVDTDKVPQVIEEHGIVTYPTTNLIRNAELVDQVEGGDWGAIKSLFNRAAM